MLLKIQNNDTLIKKKMELIPIKETLEENSEFIQNPLCHEGVIMTVDYYKFVGFVAPWIGYLVKQDENLVGLAGFKGEPINDTIEIAYATFEPYQNIGIGTEICKNLVELSLKTAPSIKITARTLPEENYSTKILRKNNFVLIGTVIDLEDGEVWEWVFPYNN